ncbi:hypothetical protein MKW94_000237 [Papaver nudicaule]|uniref:HMA domain-containing protein n=1 Tax=Papaver nudicaule TaxID=74823 RepID=A0AA41V5N2_PAPNU|nr:hypothetical protein [Papaver nudicaule]
MQKIIVQLDTDRCIQKAMKSVSGLLGVVSVSRDPNNMILTVIGDVDAVLVVQELRRFRATITSVEPTKEPEKPKVEPKTVEPIKVRGYSWLFNFIIFTNLLIILKIILSLDYHDDRGKEKAMESVSGVSGVDSLTMNKEHKKLTLIGDVDVALVVNKLRRLCRTTIDSVGPAKEPEKKKEEPKKMEPKKFFYDPEVNGYRAYY